MAHKMAVQLGVDPSGKNAQLTAEHNKTANKPGHHDYKGKTAVVSTKRIRK